MKSPLASTSSQCKENSFTSNIISSAACRTRGAIPFPVMSSAAKKQQSRRRGLWCTQRTLTHIMSARVVCILEMCATERGAPSLRV